jgi:hypothetical protein
VDVADGDAVDRFAASLALAPGLLGDVLTRVARAVQQNAATPLNGCALAALLRRMQRFFAARSALGAHAPRAPPPQLYALQQVRALVPLPLPSARASARAAAPQPPLPLALPPPRTDARKKAKLAHACAVAGCKAGPWQTTSAPSPWLARSPRLPAAPLGMWTARAQARSLKT